MPQRCFDQVVHSLIYDIDIGCAAFHLDNYPGALNDVLQARGQAISQAHSQRIGAAAPALWSGVRDRYH